jgi:hypothetical protein
MCLERGRLVIGAKVWYAPPESGGGEHPHGNSKLKMTAIAIGGYGCIVEKKISMCPGEL